MQQHGRAAHVHVHVLGCLVHALPDADQSREVKYVIGPLQRRGDVGRVPHVAHAQLDPRREITRPSAGLAVDLLDPVIEHADVQAAREQAIGEVRSNKTGATSDECECWHRVLSEIANEK